MYGKKCGCMELTNGVLMPRIGFGTWLVSDEVAENVVGQALSAGYDMIDTARNYNNEIGVGKGIRESQRAREDLFVTSKLKNAAQGYESTLSAIDESLEALGLEYLDLYLVHWPIPVGKKDCWQENIVETWRAMEEIYASGKVRAIGVSNFLPHHLKLIEEHCDVLPMVNQIEYHLSFLQEETVSYCKERGIVLEAWGPLARGGVFEMDVLAEMGRKYGKTPAQLCLAWEISKGIIPIPKTGNVERMKENLDVFDFELSREDVEILDGVKGCRNSGHNPDNINF